MALKLHVLRKLYLSKQLGLLAKSTLPERNHLPAIAFTLCGSAIVANDETLRNRNPRGRCCSEGSEALGAINFADITNAVALRSVDLEMHPDPADRIIVATSLELGQPLVTKDEKLLGLPLPTIW